MDMSSACSPPIQPYVTASDREHPRFREYESYRSAMNRQMVTGISFALWLANIESKENGREIVFYVEADVPGGLSAGWYKHKFAPRTERMTRFGPFDERHDAENA